MPIITVTSPKGRDGPVDHKKADAANAASAFWKLGPRCPLDSAAGLSLTDGDVATHPLHVLEIIDGGCFVSLVDKVNEAEAALAAGVPVEGKGALADLAVLTEEVN